MNRLKLQRDRPAIGQLVAVAWHRHERYGMGLKMTLVLAAVPENGVYGQAGEEWTYIAPESKADEVFKQGWAQQTEQVDGAFYTWQVRTPAPMLKLNKIQLANGNQFVAIDELSGTPTSSTPAPGPAPAPTRPPAGPSGSLPPRGPAPGPGRGSSDPGPKKQDAIDIAVEYTLAAVIAAHALEQAMARCGLRPTPESVQSAAATIYIRCQGQINIVRAAEVLEALGIDPLLRRDVPSAGTPPRHVTEAPPLDDDPPPEDDDDLPF